MTTFAVYVLTGNDLTASKAFVSLALFGVMSFPLRILPSAISSCVQVSLEINLLYNLTVEYKRVDLRYYDHSYDLALYSLKDKDAIERVKRNRGVAVGWGHF